MGGVGPGGFRRKVQQARVFNIVLNVAGPGGAVDGVGRRRTAHVARGCLPVHQTQLHCAGVSAVNKDALRPQGAVIQPLGMGVLQGLGNVSHQLEPLGDGERVALLAQQMVQPNRFGVVIEDQGRAEFGFFVVIDPQDAGMVDALQHFEFTARLAEPRRTGLWRGR